MERGPTQVASGDALGPGRTDGQRRGHGVWGALQRPPRAAADHPIGFSEESYMKAALWYARNDVRVEDVPEPGPPGPGEVILEVETCGICGTDLEEYRSGPLFIAAGRPN